MVSNSRFESQVMPHRAAAFNLAYWLLQDREEAEDVVQDAYLRAFRAFPTFKGGNAKAWLLMIVRNVAFTAMKHRRRNRQVISLIEDLPPRGDGGLQEVASEHPSPEALLISEADRELLQRAMAALPPAYRDILVLREMETLSYAEIAEVVGLPIGTVMSRLSRGRAELRRAMQDGNAGDTSDGV